MTAVLLACSPERRILAQFTRYGIAGGAAVGVHLTVLVVLVELAGTPAVIASLVGFACATLVNYALQHRYVFSRSSGHRLYFPRYMAVTLVTMTLNTACSGRSRADLARSIWPAR